MASGHVRHSFRRWEQDTMLRLLALAFLLLSTELSQAAPTVVGLWLTEDHSGVIRISRCGSHVCVRIAGVFVDRPDEPTPVDYRGVSQCNLPLVTDARQIQPGWWKGHITDPRNGTVWGVELHLDPHGNLALRGFLLITLLGRTQTWTRYTASVPADCRINSPHPPIGQGRALPDEPQRAQ